MKARRITRIGKKHVVVERRDLRDFLFRVGSRDEGKFDRCGDLYVYRVADWKALLDDLAESSLIRRSRRGGDCDDWCADVCSGNGGCDAGGGDPGDCVAVCDDGEVFLQLPT